ncbi:hypothetical protein JDV02_008522 [Purpureocillium takamizusanense]|uniref:SNF2 family helicase/ATPase n=1 Tax=Purpureocillium takamizusanense TaxID=2060973 RepID=A0A9Q8QQI7_9HYPO|nr:uncharacterized protein JDV02_008522 [Purpureocillium takamizusanense]UNI22657.1 hypothetical protein JDV02_008522 [Purpureocillium takamizusanense]
MNNNNRSSVNGKPGAAFAFKPRTNLSSREPPSFFKTPRNFKPAFDGDALRHIGPMVNERAPPKAPLQPLNNSENASGSQPKRAASPDDDDVAALISHKGWDSIKSKYRDLSAGSTNHPTFGHPTKMVSSRKQRANIFIQQKSRPEHHLGGTKINGPQQPSYQDRKPPPMPVFNSNAPPRKAASNYDDEVFYTDPNKASSDLKALLEGGMDDDDDAEETPSPSEGNKDAPLEPAAAVSSSAISSDATKTDQPKKFRIGDDGVVNGLKVKLLPHQVEGVNWMRGRELGPVKRGKVPKGGLLADDMGLGKTLQTVSVILTQQKPKKDEPGWKKHFEGIQKTTLVVAPLALIRQWEQEINDRVAKTHRLKVLVHHGPQRTKNFKDLAMYDVVITTYQILVSEHGHSSDAEDGLKAGCFGLHWWRVVLDEAHTIKNRNAKSTKACYALRSEYRWCLSGTPMQNNLDELQSLVRFLRIAPYDNIKQWKEHIDAPLRNGKGHIAIRRLHTILRCFMKRRTKEILKEDGALNPGGKPSGDGESTTGFRHTNRNVVTVAAELAPQERRFYDRLAARADQKMEAMMKEKISYANAFTLLLRLRQACNHPKLVEGKLEKDKDAMSVGSSQRSQDTDVDAMADLFAGMGIETKSCSVCGRELGSVDVELGRDNCAECHDDLEYFKSHAKAGKKMKKSRKSKKKTKVSKHRSAMRSEAKQEQRPDGEGGNPPPQARRRPRNRNAIIDSDDEDEGEGSWLVGEAERGPLDLGKAGGEEDENAEGGGDWLGSEDSADETLDDKDQSNLSSFVVDDEAAKKEDGYRSIDEASDDDSLLSVSALTKQMASQTLEDKPKKPAALPRTTLSAGASASEDETDESDSHAASSEDDDSSSDDGFHQSWPLKTDKVVASAKIRELIKILQAEVQEHKFIVFSQFTSMLDLVEPFLHDEGFEFTRYDGSMKNDAREESLRRLREDKSVRILLCSLKCGSLGLNLTAATRVVIIEPFWNPFVEEQAIDRVHRLTQTVDVTVYRLTVAATVEERIIDLQNKKRLLAEQTIEGGAKNGGKGLKLALEDIVDLFKPGGYQHDDPGAQGDDDYGAEAEERRRALQGMNLLRRKPVRQESAIYGRRWD